MNFLLYLTESMLHQDRLENARLNAMKSIEEGGLGLPENNTAMDRAKALGFDVDNTWYHSSLDDKNEFNQSGQFMGHSGMTGIHLTDNKEMASRYLDRYGNFDYKYKPFNKNIIPVYVKVENVKEYNSPVKSDIGLGMSIPAGFIPDYISKGHDAAMLHDTISKHGSVIHLPDGYKKSISGYELIMNKPHHIRSINAAFDPLQKHKSDLLA